MHKTTGKPVSALLHPDGAAAQWCVSGAPVPYPEAVAMMQQRVEAIHRGEAAEMVWLLEHPPLYTAGTSARAEDLKDPDRFAVYASGRGGQYTYHGPGQRVAYVMLDLRARGRDVRRFVKALEDWIILALEDYGITGEVREDRVGVWVRHGRGAAEREDKIAAIGIRLRRWISFHGIALNVCPDLSHFDGIVPCGIRGHGVTSLAALGRDGDMGKADAALRQAFVRVFGPVTEAAAPMPSCADRKTGA